MKVLILVILVFSSFSIADYGSIFYYKGSIGNNEKIQMSLEVSDSNSSKGSYIVERTGDVFILQGKMDQARKQFKFDVFKEEGDHVAARIEAQYFVDDHDQMLGMKGYWKSADGAVTKRITLEKMAEFIASGNNTSKSTNHNLSW